MTMLIRSTLALALLCLLGTAANAQDRTTAEATAEEGASPGGFFDWIHKLSGPGFVGFGLSGIYQLAPDPARRDVPKGRFRLSGAYRIVVDSHDAVDTDSVDLNMVSLQLGYEHPVWKSLHAVGGVALHRFSGNFDSFTHISLPVGGMLRPSGGLTLGTLLIVPALEGIVHIFPAFPDDSFLATSGVPRFLVSVERDGWEFVGGLAFRFDVRKR